MKSLNINLSDKESRLAYMQKYAGLSPRLLPPDALIILFLASITEKKLTSSRELLSEILTRPRELIINLCNGMNFHILLPYLWTRFNSTGLQSDLVLGPLLCEFLNFSTFNFPNLLYPLNDINIQYSSVISPSLINFEYNNVEVKNRRVNLFIRKNWWENDSATREHEIGPKMVNALHSGGWSPHLFQPNIESALHLSETSGAEIAFVDLQAAIFNQPNPQVHNFLEILQKSHRVLIGLFYDCWRCDAHSNALKYKDYFKYYWIQSREHVDKFQIDNLQVITFPYPHGALDYDLSRIESNTPENIFGFAGGIEDTNYTRIFWILALCGDRRFVFDISSHSSSTLSAYDDYVNYLNRLSKYSYGVNFSTRTDGSRCITGRSFEIPIIGRLLVQEKCPDLQYYFEPGTHYYDFDSLESLVHVFDKVTSDPHSAKKIAEEGHRFWKDKYSDKKLVSHLERLIFH